MSASNHVSLLGRLSRDPEIRGEGTGSVARFTVAVQRNFKNKDGQYEADFISCVAFGKTAEHIDKYYKKGNPISLSGNIRTGSYKNKDGQTIYTTDVAVDDVTFVPGAKDDNSSSKSEKKSESKSESKSVDPDEDFMNIEPGDMEDLPW